jgi:tetratricopeptide (TPR) repeat protein
MPTDTSRNELVLEVGQEALRQRKYDHALACFRTAKEQMPNDARVFAGMGQAYRGLGQLKRARSHFEKAARLDPAEALYLIAIAELREGAGERLEAAQARLLAGDTYWRSGRDAAALAEWDQAARLHPEAAGIEERLARYYLRQGDKGEAVGHYLRLADGLVAQNRRLAALHVCTTALALAPDDPRAREATDRAWRAVARRGPEGSLLQGEAQPGDLVTAANELAQWQLTAVFRAGAKGSGAGESGQAQRNVPLGQALLHEGRGRAGLAVAGYEQAIAAGLRLPAVFFVLGLLYRLLGRRDDADAALTLAARDPFYRQAVALIDR